MKQRQAALVRALMASSLALLSSGPGLAAPITVTGPFHHLDNRSANSVNIVPGLVQLFGANFVTPNSVGGTTGTATQSVPCPAAAAPIVSANPCTISLINVGFSSIPNFYGTSRLASQVPDDAWTLDFTNSVGTVNTATATTPTIAGATPVGFATNTSISGAGNTPTFQWTPPSGFAPEGIIVAIWDLKTTLGAGSAGVGGAGIGDIIYLKGLPGSATAVTVSAGDPAFAPGKALEPGHLYAFDVMLRDLRDPTGPNNPTNTLSQSRTFLDFVLLPAGAPSEVFIPVVDRTDPARPIYSFTPINVAPGTPIFIDPLVAVGYDYQIGAGNPNFASVTLPSGIGDNLFDLFLWDGSAFADSGTDLTGGVELLFASGGVDRFRIMGVEPSAGLDPNDVTAFITGLTFVGSGQFSGTMIPVTLAVPEPGSLALVSMVLAVFAFSRRRVALPGGGLSAASVRSCRCLPS